MIHRLKSGLSIIICTYNRPQLLGLCLAALDKCYKPRGLEVEFLVIDNGSIALDIDVIRADLSNVNPMYIRELTANLSRSRNVGYKAAKYNYVAYLDDDMLVRPNYFEVIHSVINDYNFDCFGGNYDVKFLTPPPKWLTDFGGFSLPLSIPTELTDDFARGCIMVFKNEVLVRFNGFDDQLGMKGNKIGYSEEREIQDRMKKKKLIIGYVPYLKGHHIIGKHKYKLKWHLASKFRMKSDDMLGSPISLKESLEDLLKSTIIYPYRMVRCIMRLRQKNYYIQNLVIDSSMRMLSSVGRLHGMLKYHWLRKSILI